MTCKATETFQPKQLADLGLTRADFALLRPRCNHHLRDFGNHDLLRWIDEACGARPFRCVRSGCNCKSATAFSVAAREMSNSCLSLARKPTPIARRARSPSARRGRPRRDARAGSARSGCAARRRGGRFPRRRLRSIPLDSLSSGSGLRRDNSNCDANRHGRDAGRRLQLLSRLFDMLPDCFGRKRQLFADCAVGETARSQT